MQSMADLPKEFRFVVNDILSALAIMKTLNEIGVNPQIRLNRTLKVTISMDLRHVADYKERVIKISKTLHCKLDKKLSTQGFLKYETFVNGIRIHINTSDCFYGGSPIVISHPRTRAYCQIDAKEAS